MRCGKHEPIADVIIPTMDNPEYLQLTVMSLLSNTSLPIRVVIVNNGERPIEIQKDWPLKNVDRIVSVINVGENLGWQGGINRGIQFFRDKDGLSEYVLFLNDDVRFLDWHHEWLTNMVYVMKYEPSVGAVGPVSDKVMYYQSLRYWGNTYHEIPVISGFCMLIRKEAIEKVGGLDEKLFGGDDLDYSFRLRDAGYRLACCRRSYVHHFYAQTGGRLHKDWDSREWEDKINMGLIHKHGLKKFLKYGKMPSEQKWDAHVLYDMESNAIHEILGQLQGMSVMDVGCGSKKLYEHAIGVDLVPNDEYSMSNSMIENTGVDIEADVSGPIPVDSESIDVIICKHVLEHIVDHIKALREWARILKKGGKLLIAVPDPALCDAIAVDSTHVHAFNKDSLKTVLNMTGYKIEYQCRLEGAFSLITVAVKK